MAVLAVAAVSARLCAEAAAHDGHDVVALDLHGDADTRRAARLWLPIGDAGGSAIDPQRLLAGLRAAGSAAVGWIAGAGFDGRPDLLAAGNEVLPLIGTPADAVRRVRDPDAFFGVLDAHRIPHPPTRRQRPADPAGWLSKDAGGCGGWHIRDAAAAPVAASRYFQRRIDGRPMSATFLADGREAVVVGFNALIVQPFGTFPSVYGGCVGPVAVAPAVARTIGEALAALVAAFGVRGWGSLDFLLCGDDVAVLELNPRPPASLALYAAQGQIDAQLLACLHGALPTAGAFRPVGVSGHRIVYAPHRLRLDNAAVARLAARPDVHDLPATSLCFAAGHPVCSLRAEGADAAHVRARLEDAHDALLAELAPALETTT